jgi:MFS family permease
MTSLNPDPLWVALVQAASTLPVFLLAIPAGAFADIFDKRKFLIVLETLTTAVSAIYAAMIGFGLATPLNLLGFTFLVGATGALTIPAWQAVVPQLVPRDDLASAVAANSVGVNISRALGPALGGAAITALGIVAPFWTNAISNLGVIGALAWWRPAKNSHTALPSERFSGAVVAGLRYARNSPALRATLIKAAGFFLFASAYWALLPLIARAQPQAGAAFYGLLLGAIGIGAILGSAVLGRLKDWLGPDWLVALATAGTAAALALFALARTPAPAFAASVLAGAMWTLTISTLYVSAQVALPDWVRGRGLAIFLTAIFGATTFASAIWGQIAALRSVEISLFIAAAGALLAIPLSWGSKLQTGLGVNLAPSLHWRQPRVAFDVGWTQGPALVTIKYQVAPADREAFLTAMQEIGAERKRDGAYAWGVFEELATEGRFTETFLIESWLELMHLYERVTDADRSMEERVRELLQAPPEIAHLVAPRRTPRFERVKPAA